MSQLEKVFAVNGKGLDLPLGAAVTGILGVTWLVLDQTNQQKYFVTVVFAVLLTCLCDPGGGYSNRLLRMAAVGVMGALITALGFYVGGLAWGYGVLCLFVITLISGLAVKFGVHSFLSGTLLNVWFIITLILPAGFHAARLPVHEWDQALAWLIGSAAWIAFTCIAWLASGLNRRPPPVVELPGDGGPVPLTRPVIFFAIIRAVAVAGSAAIAFGTHQPNADWMPLATLVAIKPSLAQTRLVSVQRLIGTALGGLVAIPILVAVDNKHALEWTIIILAVIGVTIQGVNYAYYTAAMAGAALIAVDLPHPTNYAAEGRRVLFTFIGVGIGVIVMFIADLLGKRSAKKGVTGGSGRTTAA